MFNSRHILAIALTTLVTAVSSLHASIHVQHLVGSTWSSDDQTLSAGSSVTITDTASGTYRIYVDDYTAENIGLITINSQSSGTPTLFVGTGRSTPIETARLDDPGCKDLAGITWSGGKPRLQARVYHDVTGDISMWHVVRIDVDGELQADVYHDGGGVTPAPRLGVVRAYRMLAAIPSTQEIVAAHGDIHRVEAQFECHADVISTEGSIDEIQASTTTPGGWFGDVIALNGSIGTIINYDGPIATECIQAKNGIGTIWGKDYILADIRANANGGSGNLTTLQMPSGGYFGGTLQANTITGSFDFFPVYIYGDFDGDAIIDTSFDGIWICGGLTTGHTIKIRQNLGEGASLGFSIFGSGFLDGQVIINADNDGSEWLGSVGVGEISLTVAPYYFNNDIGDGAVGLAPYHIHEEGCTPPNHGYVDASEFDDTTGAGGVVIRYYGPINISTPVANYVDNRHGSAVSDGNVVRRRGFLFYGHRQSRGRAGTAACGAHQSRDLIEPDSTRALPGDDRRRRYAMCRRRRASQRGLRGVRLLDRTRLQW